MSDRNSNDYGTTVIPEQFDITVQKLKAAESNPLTQFAIRASALLGGSTETKEAVRAYDIAKKGTEPSFEERDNFMRLIQNTRRFTNQEETMKAKAKELGYGSDGVRMSKEMADLRIGKARQILNP